MYPDSKEASQKRPSCPSYLAICLERLGLHPVDKFDAGSMVDYHRSEEVERAPKVMGTRNWENSPKIRSCESENK
uniref:Uncharacterized protein n=1 Tax=Romanomermis culicivorax TaxID=13658 RepID=A0A915KYZ8_ROMCU